VRFSGHFVADWTTGSLGIEEGKSHSAAMAILKIAKMGHPVLLRPADPIENPKHPEIQRLIRDMVETMEDADGAGLAAPQVHVSLRLVIYHAPPGRAEHEDDEPLETAPLTVLINPVIEAIGEEISRGWEGCLSVPGLRGEVERADHIHYRGLDAAGKPVAGEAKGFHARVIQHECDHLDGVLYPQRMADLSKLIFESEIRHILADEPNEADESIETEEDEA
jgi:peptide deformylase